MPLRNWIAAVGLLAALALVVQSKAARTEWKPEYANADPAVREWYRNAELTEEARKRFTYTKCCDHADVFRTEFRVNRSNGGDEWWYLNGTEWKLIPADIIHLDKHAPDNQPTLFIYQGKETCFFPAGSGI